MATIRDIAKAAGVSVATVSHVVNHTRYVSPELQEKVLQALEAADTVPHFVARKRLEEQTADRQDAVGYVMYLTTDLESPYAISLRKRVREILDKEGLSLVVYDLTGRDRLKLLQQIHAGTGALRGIFVSVSDPSEELIQYLQSFQVPGVIIGNRVEGLNWSRVCSANFEGAFHATSHLIHSGHERIAILCGSDEVGSNQERLDGYRRALQAHHIEYLDSLVVNNLSGRKQLYDILSRMLTGAMAPTAMFLANYEIILNTYRFLSENSIQCPRDISIVGFNDFQWAPFAEPALTTIRQDVESMADNAVRILLEEIGGRSEGKPELIEIPTEICIRASTKSIGK